MRTEFQCDVCGHIVKPITGKGRLYDVRRDVQFPLPEELEVFTCEHCGETYHNVAESQKIEDLYQASLKGKE